MPVRPTEYGSRGVIGIGVPQANPTVEQELGVLRPAGVSLVTARLVSDSPEPRGRLTDYFDDLADTLRRFDTLSLDAFGFACTGSTYIRGHAADRAKTSELEQRFGFPVITAAAAIEAALQALKVRRLVIVAPYPAWLGELGKAYWQARGFEIVAQGLARLPSADTRHIYETGSRHALAMLDSLGPVAADAILFSGTGMPTLRAVLTAGQQRGIPVLSSNLCLARALADLVKADMQPVMNSLAARIESL